MVVTENSLSNLKATEVKLLGFAIPSAIGVEAGEVVKKGEGSWVIFT